MASPGTIPATSIPGWPTPPDGIFAACNQALSAASFSGSVAIAPDGLTVPDVPTVQAALNSYAGSARQLTYNRTQKQAALDALFDANFDLAKFIRGGSATVISATNVGNFLAQITNNYRSLRSAIASAVDMAALNAININTGWPSNP